MGSVLGTAAEQGRAMLTRNYKLIDFYQVEK